MIGVADPLKGQVPRGFVVLKAGVDVDPDELAEPSWSPRCATRSARSRRSAAVDVVPALPKTRSGKILRKTMREIADGKDAVVPSTIEDAAVLDTLSPRSATPDPAISGCGCAISGSWLRDQRLWLRDQRLAVARSARGCAISVLWLRISVLWMALGTRGNRSR